MNDSKVDELIKKLSQAHVAGKFDPFIDFIQFPKFRSVRPGVRINFNFPVTVLVGQNGTGKTSVLQALYGAPEGQSVRDHWFGTAVDPIDGDQIHTAKTKQKFQGERSAFWYGYRQKDEHGNVRQLEALKVRIWRALDPDYWEPSRPIQRYGMELLPEKQRSPQIQLPVKYLSFRFNLNAFDRCFHFYSESTLRTFRRSVWDKKGRKGKPLIQDYLRHRSRRLKDAITKNSVVQIGRATMNKEPVALTDEELNWVGQIIGKVYTSGTLIDHRFYETSGRSVVLKTDHHSYSEAFAGSGESLVVNLVLEVLRAPEHSLLLLDEPETSLHPGAQRMLLVFLLEQTLKKKLQLILSTHSAELVRSLPSEAIKVFRAGPDELTYVEENLSWHEAFFVIGQKLDPAINIIVEDRLAEELVNTALASISDTFHSKFRVEHRPGGASRMVHDICLSMTSSHFQPLFLFDGDQMPGDGICDTAQLTKGELTPAKLTKIIEKQVGQRINLHEDSNESDERKVQARLSFLDYFRDRVHFLPFSCPEAVIWDRSRCEQLLSLILGDDKKAQSEATLLDGMDPKKRYAHIADKYGMPIDAVHKLFVLAFANGKSAEWDLLKNCLKTIEKKSHV